MTRLALCNTHLSELKRESTGRDMDSSALPLPAAIISRAPAKYRKLFPKRTERTNSC